MARIRWVCYTSPDGNPHAQVEPSPRSVKEELTLLRQAGFSGLITYSAEGLMGRDFAELAATLGFEGLVIGVWDPKKPEELAAARDCAGISIVLGYAVGNEGYQKAYTYAELKAVIDELRNLTNKKVTTTEEFDDYLADQSLLELGDWVLVNAHPYFHDRRAVDDAVKWTLAAYQDLKRKTNRLVMFKEVGLPTRGNAGLSEQNQLDYYRRLQQAKDGGLILFAYFEGFDLPWKTHLPVEPYWGFFSANRSAATGDLQRKPKLLGQSLLDANRGVVPIPVDRGKPLPAEARTSLPVDTLYVASGLLGDTGDLKFGAGEGKALRFTYEPLGRGPHKWEYEFISDQANDEPVRQASAIWLSPAKCWGTLRDGGYDIRELNPKAITFDARSVGNPVWVQFMGGGVKWKWRRDMGGHWVKTETFFPDTLPPIQLGTHKLSTEWRPYTCRLPDLPPAALQRVIGAFGVTVAWAENGFGPRSTAEERAKAKFVFEVQNVRLTSRPETRLRVRQDAFAVYTDASTDDNHFKPSGLMGDFGDIYTNEAWETNPHSGRTCIRVIYEGKGYGPSQPHDYLGPCRWSGVYWQYPPNNWGKDEFWSGLGYDLTGFKRLAFWARADKPCLVEFFVGGINGPYGDSQNFSMKEAFTLTPVWTEYVIDLTGTDLRHVIGGFGWSASVEANPTGAVFYLDDIVYEK